MGDNNYKLVFLFPGQGSQYRGMGQKLYEQNAVFRNSLQQSDVWIQQHLHRSLIHELYVQKEAEFDDLLITHPAIAAIEIAMYDVLKSLGIKPHYVAGTSLGEFAAAVASGAWDARQAIETAIEQAKIIVNRCEKGGMMAIIHQRKNLESLYPRYKLILASDNFEGHFTVAGTKPDLDLFEAELNHNKIQFQRLPVAFPFHSPLVEAGRNEFNDYTKRSFTLKNPQAGFISGIKSEEMNDLPENYFWDVISRYNNFPQTVKYLERKGPCLYIDLGPSGTSATFIKYNQDSYSRSKTVTIMSPYKKEDQNLDALIKFLHSNPGVSRT